MLRKLGRRLTLLNVAVSGAILIAMAFIALGVAEGMIASQSERDLSAYTRSIVGFVRETAFNGVAPVLQIPEQYTVYWEDADGRGNIVSISEHAMSDAPGVAAEARVRLAEQPATTLPDTLVGIGRGQPFDRVYGTPGQMIIRSQQTLAFARNLLIGGDSGTQFRVDAVTLADGADSAGLVLVMQDRTNELASRYSLRWLFAGCVGGGLFLIVLAGLFLSSRSIRPIEQSLRQQRAFVAAASHELRTPVAALRANAEVLRDAPLGEYQPYLDSVQAVGERMTQLVGDLVDLARADAGELTVRMAPVDLSDVAERALQWMRPLSARRGIRVEESLESAEMIGDSDRLRQALLALLDNALRYTPEGGLITVATRHDKGCAALTVADTGIGIPDEHKARVFERFYRTDEARSRESGGAGLGLSVVLQLTEQMQGTVALRDNEGGGTVFELRFKSI